MAPLRTNCRNSASSSGGGMTASSSAARHVYEGAQHGNDAVKERRSLQFELAAPAIGCFHVRLDQGGVTFQGVANECDGGDFPLVDGGWLIWQVALLVDAG